MKAYPRAALSLLVACISACGARSALEVGPCGPDPFDCVRPADDPCGPPAMVAPLCDASTGAYLCPAGAHPYARVATALATCLPFSDSAGAVRSLGGSLLRLPTDDGRCLWIAEAVETADGTQLSYVAFDPDRSAPFGTCPMQASFVGGSPTSIVQVEGGDHPGLVVQIDWSFRFAGQTQVVYRFFQASPTAAFGYDLLGGGLGRWDPGTQRIVIPDPSSLPYSTDLQLGDAALVTPDFAYVWGCPKPSQPDAFAQGCVVSRFDPLGAVQLFAGAGSWIDSLDGNDGAVVFTSGSWYSSVAPDPGSGGLLHVYVGDFGSSISSHVAAAPEGPWTAAASLGACDLPAGDTSAFCTSPIVHQELADPTRPGEVVVSYGISSTASDAGADPEGHWTRLAWVPAP
jgi:hypothetical protein